MLRANSEIASRVQRWREHILQLLPSIETVVSLIPFPRRSSKVQQEGDRNEQEKPNMKPLFFALLVQEASGSYEFAGAFKSREVAERRGA